MNVSLYYHLRTDTELNSFPSKDWTVVRNSNKGGFCAQGSEVAGPQRLLLTPRISVARDSGWSWCWVAGDTDGHCHAQETLSILSKEQKHGEHGARW